MKTLAAMLVPTLLVASPTAAAPCLTTSEAEAITLVALPEIVRQTGSICAPVLPATSLVRRSSGPFLTKYQAEADRAWPAARSAIVKLSDPAVDLLLQSSFARPLLTTLLVPQLVGRIALADCATIDRLVMLLEPLPPRNTAGLVVATLRFLRAEKAKGSTAVADVPTLPICTTP